MWWKSVPYLNAIEQSAGRYCDYSVWPYDLEYVSSVACGSWIIFTKFDLRQLICTWIIVFFDADKLYHVVTLTSDLGILWYIKCHVISLYKIWAKLSNPWLNYWKFCKFLHPLSHCDLDLELLQHSECHAFKLCTKFERNWVIHGWVIDDLAHFYVQF